MTLFYCVHHKMFSPSKKGFKPKERQLYDFGWAEGLNTYTEFGCLILGYFNTSEYERDKYLKLLKKLPRDDSVKTHLLACLRAKDMEKNPEHFGEFGIYFINYYKLKV